MGALLTRAGRIISIGINSHKSHPKMGLVKTLHAEVSCLIGVRYQDLSGATMYVSRVNKNGKIGMAKPCTICQAVLAEYNVRRIYYTNSAGQIEKMELK
jgi:cytidine deaminase